MTIQQKLNLTEINTNNTGNRLPLKIVTWLIAIIVVVFVAINIRAGAVSPRIANPNMPDSAQAEVVELKTWATQVNYGSCTLILGCMVAWGLAWRKYPRHPNLLIILAGTLVVFLDPPANWVSYVAYNPELWHYPEDWPYISLSPTIEPLVVFAYASVLVCPAFLTLAILRRVQARASADAFVWRHPLLSLAAITFPIGFIIDAIMEVFCVSTKIYTYTQVPPFGSIFVGEYNQFPLLLESTLVATVIIASSILLYRDDTGRTQSEKLAQRLRILTSRPALGSFLVMFVTLSATYFFIFGGGWWIVRAGGFATSVACPWPYPQTKVYDPQGFYELAGHSGPFFEGKWSTWMSGQPEGRPIVEGPVRSGHCGPGRE